MPTFEYTVRDQSNKIISGTSEAENEQTLARRLQEQGYLPVKVKRVRGAKQPKAAAGGQARSPWPARRSSSRGSSSAG